jgi:monofunctional biosynthetic peptidoglycan transglycosylase
MALNVISRLKKLAVFCLDCLVPEFLFSKPVRNKQISGLNFFGRIKLFLKSFLICLFSFFILVSFSGVLVYKFVPPAFTPLMLIRAKENIMKGKKIKIRQQWVPLSKISPNLPLAVVASEDNRFMLHFGFDLAAIREATRHNKKSRHALGASTITQQTAKNIFLWPNRNYIRKGIEAYFSLMIEVFWGKKRIMEMYLNEIEMGDGIYGAEAASQYYFHKSAAKLSREEAALIASVLPNPRRWRPDKPTPYILNCQSWTLWNMNNIDKVEF